MAVVQATPPKDSILELLAQWIAENAFSIYRAPAIKIQPPIPDGPPVNYWGWEGWSLEGFEKFLDDQNTGYKIVRDWHIYFDRPDTVDIFMQHKHKNHERNYGIQLNCWSVKETSEEFVARVVDDMYLVRSMMVPGKSPSSLYAVALTRDPPVLKDWEGVDGTVYTYTVVEPTENESSPIRMYWQSCDHDEEPFPRPS